ncbi:nifU-like protein 5, mitochondrial [Nymphaea colorata]|nr:nifU-like protein 5, mitochondrial [Nymphaea colorata]
MQVARRGVRLFRASRCLSRMGNPALEGETLAECVVWDRPQEVRAPSRSLYSHASSVWGTNEGRSPTSREILGSFSLGGQKRSMFIQTQSTPNPLSLMFYPDKPVMEVGSADFPNARAAMNSPLAKALFGIDGVSRVFYGSDFVTVTKSEDASWDILKPEIFAAIMDFYTSGKPLFLDSEVASSMDTAIHEDDSETVAMIKELLETRIRPAVQDDGGDIEYRGFDPDTGIVKLRMQGACSGCPSSSVTLKSGIENMLMHYVSEVKGVEQEMDSEADAEVAGQME